MQSKIPSRLCSLCSARIPCSSADIEVSGAAPAARGLRGLCEPLQQLQMDEPCLHPAALHGDFSMNSTGGRAGSRSRVPQTIAGWVPIQRL